MTQLTTCFKYQTYSEIKLHPSVFLMLRYVKCYFSILTRHWLIIIVPIANGQNETVNPHVQAQVRSVPMLVPLKSPLISSPHSNLWMVQPRSNAGWWFELL